MNLHKIYTSLLTTDLDAAEVWYTKLLGRRPDYRPMATLVQWELFDQGGLMLSNSGGGLPYQANGHGSSFAPLLKSVRYSQGDIEMKTELRQGEALAKDGAANLQKNIEAVGGKLYLTNQRLVFESHKFNIQSGVTEVELSNIQSYEKCWTKFLGFIPLFPNSLAVYTKQGKEFRFVLVGRGAWATAIETQRKG